MSVPRRDSTPTKGSLRLVLCQTADHHSSSLTRPVAMPRPFTWAARLLDKGLRCRDTAPSRQCAFSTYCQQRHLGLRVLICEAGQGGHRPCQAAAGSHQTTLGYERLVLPRVCTKCCARPILYALLPSWPEESNSS